MPSTNTTINESSLTALKASFLVQAIGQSVTTVELQSILEWLRIASADPNAATNVADGCMHRLSAAETEVAILEELNLSEQDVGTTYARTLITELSSCIRSIAQRQCQAAVGNHDLTRGFRSSHGTLKGVTSGRHH